MLDDSSRALGDVNAGEWDDWSALHYNGGALRDSQPLFAEHGRDALPGVRQAAVFVLRRPGTELPPAPVHLPP
ncbi:hypothetical protein [Streptomyces antibioticus]|uniref:hypothetical protein n=1 Tax=Streptomyces antibioticus TaxID=1890 RepID=UPI00225AD048|nr:hypothetical protein [Streptomyces antibioticus]MCX4740774.1 hypothetical protein [Streptomyces antibioticus]